MRKYLTLLYFCIIIFSCKKSATEILEKDSFRISILPVKTEGFDNFTIKGTLDVRTSSGDIEYGVVVGKSENPTFETGMRYPVGVSRISVDFIRRLNGLDTGIVYHVRAYGKHNTTTEYSANYPIGKMSPSILAVNTILSYGKPFTIATNIANIKSDASVKVFLNNLPIDVKLIETSASSTMITAQVTNQTPLGKYHLTISINDLIVHYLPEIRLLEGMWNQLQDLPRPRYEAPEPSYFMIGDWIYMYEVVLVNSDNKIEFSKYNYKTKQKLSLTPLESGYRLHGPAIVQEGELVHFIGGDLIGNNITQSSHGSKRHYVYNTTSDNWKREGDFPGNIRMDAISTIVGQKIFFGMGNSVNFDDYSKTRVLTDLWSYDLRAKVWTRVSSFPQDKGRTHHATFNIGSKMYLTAGIAEKSGVSESTLSKETWSYDASNDTWEKKADYPGVGQVNFANFTIGNFGYVGLGESYTYDSYFGRNLSTKFFKYDPALNEWTETTNIDRGIATPLSLSNGLIGLVGGGRNSNSIFTRELFIYTP
jgi:N-acetylneuraminic acid mutarotase